MKNGLNNTAKQCKIQAGILKVKIDQEKAIQNKLRPNIKETLA